MANTRISDLTASASNLAATDLIPVVQTAGVGPVKMTGTQIKAWIVGAGSVSVASGKTLTVSNTLTFTGTDSSSVAFGTGGTVLYSGGRINPRVVTIADGTSVTIDGDTTDVAIQTNTQVAGTLTMNAPTGTPVDGQKLIFRIKSTNAQTYSWNGIFAGSTDVALPAASTAGKTDYVGFMYNSTDLKWQLVSRVAGF